MSWSRIDLKVGFATPAFLGGADKRAEVRVPPLKHLFRSWWRIAVAKDHEYDVKKIRLAEQSIFGSAGLDGSDQGIQRRARVTFSVDEWKPGIVTSWNLERIKITHPNMDHPIDAALYLGYGPLKYKKDNKGIPVLSGKTTYVPAGTTFKLGSSGSSLGSHEIKLLRG